MNAPERIWAYNELRNGYTFTAFGPQPHFAQVEYVRADLFAAEKARADKAEALLAEAVKALEAADVQFNCVVSPKGAYEAAKEAVRTTLAKIKEAKNG